MEFRQLEAFVNAAKYKSFSKAADATFLTQPTISTHVSNLENELGVRLLNRSGREISLTPHGHEFYSYAVELLNTRSRLISEMDVSTGTINSALVSPRELFVEALQKNAVSIILLHNHPSGDPTPSKDDLLTTRRIREAGVLIGIELLDHIIIGDNCYFSLREKGFFSQESANR